MKKLQRRQGPVHDQDFGTSREITTFGHQRPLAHAKWTFQKHFRCAGAQCLGPKGARVGHSVCIVRQVLSRGQEYFGFDVH